MAPESHAHLYNCGKSAQCILLHLENEKTGIRKRDSQRGNTTDLILMKRIIKDQLNTHTEVKIEGYQLENSGLGENSQWVLLMLIGFNKCISNALFEPD